MEAFAWPGTVLVIVLVFIVFFRRSIASKLTGIQQIDGKNKSITFDQNIKKKEAASDLNFETVLEPELIVAFENVLKKDSGIDELKTDSEKLETLLRYSSVISISYHFDLIYEKIMGSQILLLQKLNVSGMVKEQIQDYYEREVEDIYPILKDNYSFNQYFDFLDDEALIATDENSDNQKDEFFITIFGKNFLTYIISEGLSMEKEY